MTPSNVSGTTTPVPSDQDYQAPVNTKSRIADKFRRLAEVEVIGHDGQPHAVSAPAAAPVAGSSIPSGQPVTMVNALLSAAASAGVDPGALTDSQSFMLAIGSISPADTDGITGAIRDALALNPSIAIAPAAPGMKVNPAQGSSGSGWKPTPTTAADRIRAEASKAMGQPRPPGSTTY